MKATAKAESREQKAGGTAFFRGVRVGPLAMGLLVVIVAAVAGNRRLKAESREPGAGRLRCVAWLLLVAVLPEVEPHWQAWFFLGALFGAGAFFLLRMVEWFDSVKAEFGEERMNGPLNGEGIWERLDARVLADHEHREILLQCHAAAMMHPRKRVDIRGVPILWHLSEEQREQFLRWVPGQIVRWGAEDQEWEVEVHREAGFVFLRFWRLLVVIPRDETEKVIVAKGGRRS